MKRSRGKIQFPLLFNVTIALLFIWLTFYILSEFKNYLRPIVLGVLFAYFIFPVANYLEKRHLPRILSNIIGIILGLAIVYGVLFFISKESALFLTNIPEMKYQAAQNINTIFSSFENMLGITSGEIKNSVSGMIETVLSNSANVANTAFGITFNTLFTIFVIPVYVFFLLYYRNKFKAFVLMLIPRENHDKAERIIEEVNSVAMHYITGVFFVVTILFVINSLGFLIIGLRFALLLGLFAALMNFIPYYGTIIGYLFPFFIAVFTMDSPEYAFLVVLQFIIVQFTENNILTPNIVGAHVNINPFMIILAITFGGFIWGLPGMFIAVPVVAVLRVLGENVERLKPIGFLLGKIGAEEHAVTIDKIKRVFRGSRRSKKG
ncbi:MAG: AI-2E family transporter [Bacteroidetes bacterium]|nr:MAG: AI-2E family transporter [Bacteroidota bacterium]